MKLIVGLGNPGLEYQNTRHNVGFYFLDMFIKENNLGNFQEKFNGLYLKTKYQGVDVIFLKPLSYMNNSGEVIAKFANYYKIKSQDILIIHDDLDISLGKIKLKENGSSGGHNGIKSTISCLATEDFKRLKIGISKANIEVKDYVLGKFSHEEQEVLASLSQVIISLIDDYFHLSFNDLMSKYNRRS